MSGSQVREGRNRRFSALAMLLAWSVAMWATGCQSNKPNKPKKEEHKVYAREGGTQPAEYWPQGGMDAGAPIREGREMERQQTVSDATPPPKSSLPIDRQLDPTGLPVTSPTP